MRTTRLASIASGTMLGALLAACSSVPLYGPNSSYPASYPATAPVAASPAYLEYGRVTNIEYFPGGPAASGVNVPGAILGAVAGAVLGNVAGDAVGGRSTRNTASLLGGVAGAAVGSQAGRSGAASGPVYRISLQTDQGALRSYDVPAPGDLRIGDRVRVENGVIYRS